MSRTVENGFLGDRHPLCHTFPAECSWKKSQGTLGPLGTPSFLCALFSVQNGLEKGMIETVWLKLKVKSLPTE